MIEEIRELFQNLVAPQLEGIKGDIRAIDSKLESYRREWIAETRRIEEVLSVDFVRLEQKVDLRFEMFDTRMIALQDTTHEKLSAMNEKLSLMNEKLDLHGRELLAEIKAALK
jgi:hypothetical protein